MENQQNIKKGPDAGSTAGRISNLGEEEISQVIETEWTIINQEEEFESAVLGLQQSSLGEFILEDCKPSSSSPPPPSASTATSSSSSSSTKDQLIQRLEEQVIMLTNVLEEERFHQQKQFHSAIEEIDNLKKEKECQEQEIRNLRKERDFWQKKSVESAEGMKVHDEVVIGAFHSLRTRLSHLAQEARSYRILEESGGHSNSTKCPTEISSTTTSGDQVYNGTIDSNLEDTLNALIELENEFIPIISKLHSSFSHTQQSSPNKTIIPCSSSSHASKISLSSFEENDLALFFPTPKGDYLAFNCGAPHHYLSAESKALIGQDKHFRKIYVLGKIVFKEERIASSSNSPYHLAPGIKYYEVSVASVTSQLS